MELRIGRERKREEANGTPYRLAAIDIDDTLLGPDRMISAANGQAIADLRRAGVLVVLASGRSHENMLRYHHELGLGDGPVASVHGAIVREAGSGEIWLVNAVAPAAAAAATREAFERGLSILHYRRDGVYVQARTQWTTYDEARGDNPQIEVADLLEEGGDGVVKVMWLGEPAEIAAIAPEVRERYAGVLNVTETDPGYLEFTAPAASKGTALAAISERLGFTSSEVVAFGDGNNDVPMLAWAGLGVAMSHARPAAMAAADIVTPEGDPETSLARAISLVLAGTGPARPIADNG